MSRTVLAVALAVALAVPALSAAGAVPDRSAGQTARGLGLAARRAQLQELLAQLTRHRARLRQVRQQERRVLDELEDIDRTREQAERRLAALTAELRTTRRRAEETAAALAVMERRLQRRREALAGRMRDIYKYGRTGYAEVLLGAADFGEFVTRWQFLSTIVEADAQQIAAYREEVVRARELSAALIAEQAQLRSLAAQADQRRREVLAREQAKRTMLQRLQVERAAFERMVKELEEDSRQLEILIRRAQAARPSVLGAVRRLGQFLWPTRGVFTSGFGIRRHPIFGIRRMHTGQDIAAPWGAPVVAAAPGRVIYTGWFGGYGKIVVIDHGGGVSTLYAHLSSIAVPAGAVVRRGQLIGRVGSTGYSTGPHVHFEIRIDGRPVDPQRR